MFVSNINLLCVLEILRIHFLTTTSTHIGTNFTKSSIIFDDVMCDFYEVKKSCQHPNDILFV